MKKENRPQTQLYCLKCGTQFAWGDEVASEVMACPTRFVMEYKCSYCSSIAQLTFTLSKMEEVTPE